MNYAVSIDIGGTNTRVAKVDANYHILERQQFPTNALDAQETLDQIATIIKQMQGDIVGVGMSCPGPLDLIHNTILEPPNLKGTWRNLAIVDALKEKIHLPVYLNNDANLAALAEATIGEGKDYRKVQFLTISTGIGAGLVLDKELYIGAHGFANEIANCIMIQDGPCHGSILPGGIEAISSGTAITKRAQKAGLNVVHAGQVNDLALQGNVTAQMILAEAKNYLANFIAFIYSYMDPDIVILGGSVSLKMEGFVEDVQRLVKQKVYAAMRPHINIKKTTLCEDSGLLGSACLVYQKERLS